MDTPFADPAAPSPARELRSFSGPPTEFWSRLVRSAGEATGAATAMLWARTTPSSSWAKAAAWAAPDSTVGAGIPDGGTLAEACVEEGGRLHRRLPDGAGVSVLGTRLDLPGQPGDAVLLAARPALPDAEADPALARLEAVAAAASVYHLQRLLTRARADVEQFGQVLDLLVLLNRQATFMAAAMTLCNELASRFRADRASLGWRKGAYVRVRAISHLEKFEPKMAVVQHLEAAMEESLEQDIEVSWPADPEAPYLSRDHGRFAEAEASGHVASVPLRQDGRPVGILTLERKAEGFSEAELRGLRAAADQVAPRLADLELREGWFGRRWGRALLRGAGKLVGTEHTGAKLASAAGAALAAFLIFGSWPHRVEAPFTLRSERAVVIPAPFDGYLGEVAADAGDTVGEGEALAALDIRGLLIEEASAAADLERHLREAEKAQAERALAEMRMAQALAAQAQARLDLVRDRLDRAHLRAPFAGAVVEGDHRERLGAPVRQGEPLFRIAGLEELSVEAFVPERDVDFVIAGAEVRLVFASRPGRPYPAQVARIDPMARTREGGQVFVARCVVAGEPEAWWRPGMTGVARIEAGRRAPIWLLTRRTVDFVRLRWGW